MSRNLKVNLACSVWPLGSPDLQTPKATHFPPKLEGGGKLNRSIGLVQERDELNPREYSLDSVLQNEKSVFTLLDKSVIDTAHTEARHSKLAD